MTEPQSPLRIADATVDRIVLAAGTYEFDVSTACESDSASWLCVDRAVTIEAAEAGTVVLDAKGARRVFKITGTGVQLVGLNITGGSAVSSVVLAFRTFWTFLPAPRWNVTQVLAFCMQGVSAPFLNRPTVQCPDGTLRD